MYTMSEAVSDLIGQKYAIDCAISHISTADPRYEALYQERECISDAIHAQLAIDEGRAPTPRINKGHINVCLAAETAILMNAMKNPALALSVAKSLKAAKQSQAIRRYAQPHQVQQFDRIAQKLTNKLLKKVYLLTNALPA